MKNLITILLITSTITFSPAIHAEQNSLSPILVAQENTTTTAPEDTSPSNQDSTTPSTSSDSTTSDEFSNDEEYEGTPVSQATNKSSNAAKKKRWRNIVLAVVAIAVAVTALILIANNDGHRSKH